MDHEPVVSAGSRKVPTAHVCPNCGETLPTRRVDNVWVEDLLDGGWVVAYRLVAQDGRPIVGEVRVFPRTKRPVDGPGTWEAERKGSRVTVPPGGLPTSILRGVRLSVAQAAFPEVVRKARRAGVDFLDLVRDVFTPTAIESSGKHDDYFFAVLANDYFNAVLNGSRSPIQDLANLRGVTSGYMSQLVHDARTEGMLTPSAVGKSGGQLTDKARELLDEKGKR